MEFAAWCTRLQLPSSLVPELFEALDVRQALPGQLLTSAFGFLQTAFEKADGEGDGNGVVDLPELARLATPLGVSSANVAQLFAERPRTRRPAHAARAGAAMGRDRGVEAFHPLGSIKVPPSYYKIGSSLGHQEHVHIYELRFFGDAECHLDRICELPISSGHFEAGPGANGSAAFTAGRAFDLRAETRWVSQRLDVVLQRDSTDESWGLHITGSEDGLFIQALQAREVW
eukprot:g31103.t1